MLSEHASSGPSTLDVDDIATCVVNKPHIILSEERVNEEAITSKIKHAIKHKTRLTQLLQPSLAFCFSLQPMTAYRPVLDGTPSLAAS